MAPDCYSYHYLDRMMAPHTQDPYPTWTRTRGEDPQDTHPWTEQELEVNPRINWPRGTGNGAAVAIHRIEGPTLDPGRVLTHPSRLVAPLLISSNQPQTFDIPQVIIDWVPNPIVQRSFGQYTLAVDDMRHTVPKEILGYSYDALSQQEIADAAALKVRQAMYGR